MKKIIYLLISLVVIVASCEKSEKRSINDHNIEMSGKMTETEGSIIEFLELMDDESNEIISVNQAVYFLEAGFNYRYANLGNDNDLTITYIDTCIVSIDIYEGYCSYSDLKSSFDMVYELMEVIFTSINEDQKALSIVQISLTEDDALQVVSVWKYSQFTFGGDWRWGLKSGKCDGTYAGRDATNAITWFFNINFSNPPSYGIWTNVTFSQEYHASHQLMYEPNNPFGYFHSLLFFFEQWSGQPIHCMTQAEVYYYASQIPEVINRIVTADGITNSIINIVLGYDLMTVNNPYPIMHKIKLMHGDYTHTNHIPAEDFLQI